MENQSNSEHQLLIVCQDNQGTEIRANVVRLTRHMVVFEVYSPSIVLHMSEALNETRIYFGERQVYSGRSVVNNLINTPTVQVCEATLEDSWLDLDFARTPDFRKQIGADLESFLAQTQKAIRILPEFKIAVADLQLFLLELKQWLEQVELGIRSQPAGDRSKLERDALQELQKPLLPFLGQFFERFEYACKQIDETSKPAHRNYVKKQLHPLVLCAPFMYRTFAKPLGYAGDYEMVAMMVRDPYQGGSLFAKVLNTFFLATPPVVAHRNRIQYLKKILTQETCRVMAQNRTAKIFNLGCGPAKEIEEFLTESEVSKNAAFTLLDFNEETINYTTGILSQAKSRAQRPTDIQFIKKSVIQIVKEAAKPASMWSSAKFDLVYCAGLFDYLSENVCQKLTNIFYDIVVPGGLVAVTNVDISNPARNWMEYSVDWHLFYRGHNDMVRIIPRKASAEQSNIVAEPSGVNIFLEVRKP